MEIHRSDSGRCMKSGIGLVAFVKLLLLAFEFR